MQLRRSVIVVLSRDLECLWVSVCLSERSCSCLGSEPAVSQPLGSVSKQQQQQQHHFQGTHGWGSLSSWVLWGAPAPFPRASKGQKKTKGNLSLLFYLKCRAESVNPSSCLGVVAVSMSADSRRPLLSFVTRKSIVQRRVFKTCFADSFSSKLCALWSSFSFALTNSWLWNLSEEWVLQSNTIGLGSAGKMLENI